MKKLFTFIMALFLTASAVQANNADLFQLDEQTLKVEMAELDQLEEYVTENNMQWEDFQGIDKINFDASASLMAADFSFDNMDWISFAWGLICCPVGFFVVAINDDKTKDEKTSYWIGVIAGVVLGGISSGISIAL